MTFATNPDWLTLGLYAGGAAILLILLFRLPYIGGLLRFAFSVGMLGLGLLLLARQAPFDPTLSRFASDLGFDNQAVSGEEVRISLGPDGHFWAMVAINGIERRMLVDSGATVTAVSTETARQAGIETSRGPFPVILRTANGTVEAETGRIARLSIGGIEAVDLPVIVAPNLGPVDVLGMNFLSELASWRVEGKTLILQPKRS